MIPLQVKSISLSNVGFVVMLTTEDGERNLPIFIGVPEAQSIALQVNRVKPPRPMTHDLMKNLLDLLECRVERIIINDIDEGTFYARLKINYDDRVLDVDSRPSDAIALALRCGVPIEAEEKVMDEAGVAAEDIEGEESDQGKEADDDEKSSAEPQSEVQRLKNQLDKAIREERYEEAARLRDQIKQRESTN